MKRIRQTISIILIVILKLNSLTGQIYDPEGINMPGSWNDWANPPTNSVLASAEQAGGSMRLDATLNIYQTRFATPTNVAAGSYEFLFSSGPETDYWKNKWADANFTLNTVQNITLNGTNNNTVTLSDNKWYVVNYENNNYTNTRAVFMELSAEPVSITNVTRDIASPTSDENVTVSVTCSAAPSENLYLRYTTDSWASSAAVPLIFSGTTGSGSIARQAEGTTVEYYVFSTSIESASSDYDLITIEYNNNNGSNYSYTTTAAPLSCTSTEGVLTTDPVFPIHDQGVTITFDATRGNGDLMNYAGDIYAHTGLITSESDGNNDWQHIKTEWGVNTDELKFTRISTNEYQLNIDNIRTFYDVPADEEIYKITMVIRSDEPIDASVSTEDFYVARNADSSDFHLEVYTQGTNVRIAGNLSKDPLVDSDTQLAICVDAMDADNIKLKIDNSQVDEINDTHMMYALHTADYNSGLHEIIASATDGTNIAYDTTYFYIRGAVTVQDMPAGMKNGINYIDDNTVTLVLHDPSQAKEFAFVIGDFNNWTAGDEGYMKKTPDGTHFWTTITGLTPGEEYAYQYYIDGELKLADPYCDKILDPWNDRWIPETTYPELKTYPWDMTLGSVSVLQTGQTSYSWQVPNFTPSAVNETQSDLIIYELLVRDFVESRAIKDVIPKLSYLLDLGVNAIELMPIAEFEGNDSWGYAPNFYYAPDKAYGTKNDYKEFIDECHKRGIAVILDVVYNHMYGSSPFVQMYWDEAANLPASNNAWFNRVAPHPYSIGYDLNHESDHTRNLVKDNLTYWMTEYKIDGFRFDLAKGFTQNNSGEDIAAWSAYDQSRINIITDYYNHIKSVNSNAYVILENFADNSEETVLANNGCMLWGVMTEQFAQATMGYQNNSDFSAAYFGGEGGRGWNYPNLIPFMESHDEERQMFQNMSYAAYGANNLETSLKFSKAAATFYMAIPGPKMIWQFGELGYDEGIELCPDGTYTDDCRTAAKPIHWEYRDDPLRKELYMYYSWMSRLKKAYPTFREGAYTRDFSGTGKRMWLSHSDMNVVVAGNFGTTAFDMTPGFQHTGTWYDFYSGESVEISDAAGHTVNFQPGDIHLWTDKPVGIVKNESVENTTELIIYPNPASDFIFLDLNDNFNYIISDITGKQILSGQAPKGTNKIDISKLNPALYIIHLYNDNTTVSKKINVK